MHAPDLDVAKEALVVARESVLKQQADVRECRVVAGALLTGTSVAVSFLGGRALDSGAYVWLAYIGLGFFVMSLLSILRVLLPGLPRNEKKRLQEISKGMSLIRLSEQTSEAQRDAGLCKRLVATYDDIHARNDTHMRPLNRYLGVASLLLVFEVAAWGMTIGLDSGDAASKTACTPATIAGQSGCLARGQRCDPRNEAQYEHYDFICTRRAGDGRPRLR